MLHEDPTCRQCVARPGCETPTRHVRSLGPCVGSCNRLSRPYLMCCLTMYWSLTMMRCLNRCYCCGQPCASSCVACAWHLLPASVSPQVLSCCTSSIRAPPLDSDICAWPVDDIQERLPVGLLSCMQHMLWLPMRLPATTCCVSKMPSLVLADGGSRRLTGFINCFDADGLD